MLSIAVAWQWPMSLLRGLVVAGATGTAGGATPGDHAVAVAVIAAVSSMAAVVIGPVVASRMRDRRRQSPDDLVELLMEQLNSAQKENARLRKGQESRVDR